MIQRLAQAGRRLLGGAGLRPRGARLLGAAGPRRHIIGTDAAAAQDERVRVKAMLERPELAKGLAKLGLTPSEATARVDALADGEVLQLAGKLDAAIAAGQISNETLLLIIILVLVLVILL